MDFAVPAVQRIKLKESEDKNKSGNLARELKKNMKVAIIPIRIGALIQSLNDYERDWRIWK